MAENVKEIQRWLSTLHPTDRVAVDDGGLTLVALDSGGLETGAYYEIGGVPEEEHPVGCICADCSDADLTADND